MLYIRLLQIKAKIKPLCRKCAGFHCQYFISGITVRVRKCSLKKICELEIWDIPIRLIPRIRCVDFDIVKLSRVSVDFWVDFNTVDFDKIVVVSLADVPLLNFNMVLVIGLQRKGVKIQIDVSIHCIDNMKLVVLIVTNHIDSRCSVSVLTIIWVDRKVYNTRYWGLKACGAPMKRYRPLCWHSGYYCQQFSFDQSSFYINNKKLLSNLNLS